MQFKILLLRSDTDAALECLQDVAASAEFTPEILQVSRASYMQRDASQLPLEVAVLRHDDNLLSHLMLHT